MHLRESNSGRDSPPRRRAARSDAAELARLAIARRDALVFVTASLDRTSRRRRLRVRRALASDAVPEARPRSRWLASRSAASRTAQRIAFAALNTALLRRRRGHQIAAGAVVEGVRPSLLFVDAAMASVSYPRNLDRRGREAPARRSSRPMSVDARPVLHQRRHRDRRGDERAVVDHYKMRARVAATRSTSRTRPVSSRRATPASSRARLARRRARAQRHQRRARRRGRRTRARRPLLVDGKPARRQSHAYRSRAARTATATSCTRASSTAARAASSTARSSSAPDAQKTDARQTNRNLLLSRRAADRHRSRQLEIYADDVKCTHGATIGQLDEDALFYLRSRGIGEDEGAQPARLRLRQRDRRADEVDAVREHVRRALFARMPHGCRSGEGERRARH